MRLARAMGRKMTATATLLLGSVAAVDAPAQDEQVTYNSHAGRSELFYRKRSWLTSA